MIGTHQGSPNAVLEAVAGGIPVIANASGGTAEMVRGGATGWLLAEGASAAEIAAAMEQAIAEPHTAARFASNAREFVRKHHRIEDMADRYLALLADRGGAA